MNKTISIHLGGSVFNIEEEAYARLESYLQSIKNNFTGDASADEIMQDIESRIAELFHSRMENGRTAVVLKDVEEVIIIMGQPEDYSDGTTSQQQEKTRSSDSHTSTTNPHRRVYRDKDDALVAGVCSGLSHYIGWDPVLVRLLAAVLIFFSGGVGVIVYLLLWASIPVAATTAEKLQMRGESVTVDNIARFVNDEARSAAENLRKASDRFQQRRGSGYELISVFGKVMRKLVGSFLVLLGIALVFALIGLLIATESPAFGGASLQDFRDFVFPGEDAIWLAIAGAILILATPAIGFLYSGFRMVIGNSRRVPGLSVLLFILFIVGVCMTVTAGLKLGSGFKEESTLNTTIRLDSSTFRTLTIFVQDDSIFKGRKDTHYELMQLTQRTDSGTWLGTGVHLQFEPSNDPYFRVEIERRASGSTLNEATSFAEGIKFQYSMTDSTLVLGPNIFIPEEIPYRGQCVNVTVHVPVQRYVYFGENVGYVYWNREMKNRYRRMTRDGWDETFDETGGTLPSVIHYEHPSSRYSLLSM